MEGKVAKPDWRVAKIAARQHGAVSIDQLRLCGLGEGAIERRVAAGRLHRVHRGVYAVGHTALGLEGEAMAAVLAVGRGAQRGGVVLEHWGAAASHRSAAALWRLVSGVLDPCDVIVAGNSGRAARADVRVHRSITLIPAQVTLCRGVPVTTPARTIADLRRAVSARLPGAPSPRELRAAIRQANVLGLSIDEKDSRDRTRSGLESAFLALCRRLDVRQPEVNVRVGPYLVDFLWRDERLVVETDGYRYHRGRTAFEDDRARDLELMRLGYRVLRLSERQVEAAPLDVADVLTLALDTRKGGRTR
ncbi:MAG TPA: type IV toxin-antitoxin system AbiEi family antitoxin domain-containing protein [Solirubrobacterales bacterium]|nr:type IV toxin-antitoxin system AbiEi family antitoxin domain-containing protein [Solirubrobacterales bacterium]